jgi:hypothetical protein
LIPNEIKVMELFGAKIVGLMTYFTPFFFTNQNN